ncbi:hypothetical protein E3N88_06310 [Mikania micrantha]|uniref:peroxidase n=1 Tax=Mikania micrantha TaxID=192012 RepID=A0A5N6PNE0_9ASTR|nr:hypothetical protein E3N88_06310 [Mikania micrantha]
MEVSSALTKMIVLLVLLLATLALGQGDRGGRRGTRVGFYRSTCPRVESIVQSAVRSAVRANPTIAPGLLRMFFHDCFIKGCDASILIDGASTEKSAGPNAFLRGFEVIDAAKSQLETTCPGVVSCADIVALAARDSVVLTGGRSWQVPLGRRDGLVSQASDTANLPGFNEPMSAQIQKFADKGLNTQDLVTLVGGHTIGTAACALFSYRLYNFNNTNGPDPDINQAFLPQLRALCPNGGDGLRRVALDTGSDNRFGSSFYENLRNGRGAGGTSWQVPLGRRDGLVSQASDTVNLPAFNDPVSVQITKFADKNLNTQDLVTLVGGHTIGTGACVVFSYRLYNFNGTNLPDPSINPSFLPQLQALCPNGGDGSTRVALDTGSVTRFDNSFYSNLRNGRGAGGTSWQVPLGRRDGLVSQASDTANLPAFNDPISVQITKFADKNLNTQDLVTLVGGHTIGTAACAVFSYRLYNFNNTNRPDPDINPSFLPQLQALCPSGGDGSTQVALDTGSDNRFDNSFYSNLRDGRGVLESDAKLWSDPTTRPIVQRFLGISGLLGLTFNVEFGRSMVKMGNIELKTGSQGEIRRVCSAIN